MLQNTSIISDIKQVLTAYHKTGRRSGNMCGMRLLESHPI